MFKKEDLQKTPEYWLETIQNELYKQVIEFMKHQKINQTELAERLGVSKGYISQILKGQFNYTLKKLIELSLAIGKVPNVQFEKYEEFINKEKKANALHSYEVVYSSKNIIQSSRFRESHAHVRYPDLNAKKSMEEKYIVVKHKLAEHRFNQEENLINF